MESMSDALLGSGVLGEHFMRRNDRRDQVKSLLEEMRAKNSVTEFKYAAKELLKADHRQIDEVIKSARRLRTPELVSHLDGLRNLLGRVPAEDRDDVICRALRSHNPTLELKLKPKR